MNKKILQLAIPSIVSNITVPLLGLIDVAIVGHLGSAAYIGAIAVGGMLFNIIYWLFEMCIRDSAKLALPGRSVCKKPTYGSSPTVSNADCTS